MGKVKVLREWPWKDGLALLAVLGCVALGYCSANGKWTAESWKQPSAYLDPVKSDVIFHLAIGRAVMDGDFVPFGEKTFAPLGAPYDGNWNDWPIIEEFPLYAMGLLSKVFGLFAGLELTLLLGQMLAGSTFFLVARYLKVDTAWSAVTALAFGLAPFIFAQSPHHILVALCWHVPLFLVVWQWVSAEPGVRPFSGRFWFGVAVGALAGFQMVYYTGIFCQLVLLGAAVTFLRNRSIPSFVSAICFISTAAVAFGLMNVDSWLYHLREGANPGALVREYKWLEIYGLKLVDLFVPPLGHQSELLRTFSEARAGKSVLQDEGSYLGFFGIGSLLLLVFTSVRAVIYRRTEDIPLAAWQILWILVFFSTGGLNAIGGLFGITMFRAACRYSVVILAIALLYSGQRLTAASIGHRPLSLAAALAAALIILWDQVPLSPSKDVLAQPARQVESDRIFVKAMEAALPAGAMLFQIPVMDFPEAPAPGVPPYDHLRPYLYSTGLRYSFGSMKGRPREKWQQELGKMPLADAVAEMQRRGFGAVYINRNGFPDKAKGIVDSLRSQGFTAEIQSPEGDLVCVPLGRPVQIDPPPIKLFP